MKNVHRGGEKWLNEGYFARYGIFVSRESGQIINKSGYFSANNGKTTEVVTTKGN
jgi:hypothetical protein